jgi:hypothetical protein
MREISNDKTDNEQSTKRKREKERKKMREVTDR